MSAGDLAFEQGAGPEPLAVQRDEPLKLGEHGVQTHLVRVVQDAPLGLGEPQPRDDGEVHIGRGADVLLETPERLVDHGQHQAMD